MPFCIIYLSIKLPCKTILVLLNYTCNFVLYPHNFNLLLGVMKQKVNIAITRDDVDEELEKFNVVLVDPQNTAPDTLATLGSIDDTVVTIVDEAGGERTHHIDLLQ